MNEIVFVAPFRVVDDGGWQVKDALNRNVYGEGWYWNSRSVARCVRDEYAYFASLRTNPETPA